MLSFLWVGYRRNDNNVFLIASEIFFLLIPQFKLNVPSGLKLFIRWIKSYYLYRNYTPPKHLNVRELTHYNLNGWSYAPLDITKGGNITQVGHIFTTNRFHCGHERVLWLELPYWCFIFCISSNENNFLLETWLRWWGGIYIKGGSRPFGNIKYIEPYSTTALGALGFISALRHTLG